jgi:hypothetical protein
VKEAANNRFIVSSSVNVGDMNVAMKKAYPNAKVMSWGPSKFMLCCCSTLMCDSDGVATSKKMGVRTTYNHSKAEKVLGIKFKDPIQSAIEMGEQIMADGYQKAK